MPRFLEPSNFKEYKKLFPRWQSLHRFFKTDPSYDKIINRALKIASGTTKRDAEAFSELIEYLDSSIIEDKFKYQPARKARKRMLKKIARGMSDMIDESDSGYWLDASRGTSGGKFRILKKARENFTHKMIQALRRTYLKSPRNSLSRRSDRPLKPLKRLANSGN